jgi:hypothetical protein
VAEAKSTPSDHDDRQSAPVVFGSPRRNASPIDCLCRVRDRLLLERGTLVFGAGHYRAGWFLLDDDAVELDDPMGWEPLTHDRACFENETLLLTPTPVPS